ncbi:hypothetical protein ACLOJK_027196 [Asimina triloba]
MPNCRNPSQGNPKPWRDPPPSTADDRRPVGQQATSIRRAAGHERPAISNLRTAEIEPTIDDGFTNLKIQTATHHAINDPASWASDHLIKPSAAMAISKPNKDSPKSKQMLTTTFKLKFPNCSCDRFLLP